eukprot:TRINITY_DN2031_c0_g1_i1.p1 TRINITY_DN2031_c0_g1~~TRINITY_DN2031_c0_g1_i1.p1  ORF type:complete len:254 (+),score=30.97 TRINITY_DN2031_c0_g1_i1:141-902(+)
MGDEQRDNLFVKGFPLTWREAELHQLFSSYGEISQSTVFIDKLSAISKGFGLVRFASESAASMAQQALNGFVIEGSPLVVKYADGPMSKAQRGIRAQTRFASLPTPRFHPYATAPAPVPIPVPMPYRPQYQQHTIPRHFQPAAAALPEPPVPGNLPPPEDGSNLFIGGLSSRLDEVFLYRMMAPFGAIASLRLQLDPHTGQSKGYGFVRYQYAADAMNAITAYNGLEFDGETIIVQVASVVVPHRGAQPTRTA